MGIKNFSNVSDKELLGLLKQSNRDAISHLFDKYAPLLYGITVNSTSNQHTANAILQSAFINILKECRTLDCVNAIFPWILKITHRTALSEYNVQLNLRLLAGNAQKYPFSKKVSQDQQTPTLTSLRFSS